MPGTMALHPWWPSTLPHPHLPFELLAYTAGFQLFLWQRRRRRDSVDSAENRGWLTVAALCGAAIGAKVLFWLEDPTWTAAHLTDLPALMTGKTVVGGFLGGWSAVELAKSRLHIAHSTGDVLVLPMVLGLILGRLGCFFSGVDDATHGTPVPWGMDLGDGIPRHPTALYEIVFLLGLTPFLNATQRDGRKFLMFMAAYLAFRLVAESIKIQPFPYFGLSGIQAACILGLGAVIWRWNK